MQAHPAHGARAVGRGRLKPIIVRNHSTGTPVTLRVQQYAWHVPTLVFDILSIPMLQKDRIQVNLGAFNERTAPMNYLRDYTTGAVVKLSLMNGIFVMKPVNAAQVPASLRGEIEATSAPAQTKGVAEGIMPRRHHNIPLWFVFGCEQTPLACTIAVSSGKRTGQASLGDEITEPTPACTVLSTHGYGEGSVLDCSHPDDWFTNQQCSAKQTCRKDQSPGVQHRAVHDGQSSSTTVDVGYGSCVRYICV